MLHRKTARHNVTNPKH